MFWGGIYVSQTQNCVYFAGSVWFNGGEGRGEILMKGRGREWRYFN
jgi:hypothetical protein